MILTQKALSRRTVLRGMGVSMALPFMDAMVPAMAARGWVLRGRRSAWASCTYPTASWT